MCKHHEMPHFIIPPYLLERLSEAADLDTAPGYAAETLRHDQGWRDHARTPLFAVAVSAAPTGPNRKITDAHGKSSSTGTVVRREGEPAVADPAVNEAYDGLGATYKFYSEVFQRNSIDGNGSALDAVVHYGRGYDNAFWDGSRMNFGDGDGKVFNRFTKSLSVIGHELTHGVTQYSAKLAYRGQAGALNESVSDVFGVLVEQYKLGQKADAASWLVGEGLFTDKVQGVAIRSMKAPGTAYDDPALGKDPQRPTMSGYVKTTSDNGGVHINSGIPNHAFYLTAATLGGHAWERAGRIWYQTLTGGKVSGNVDFAGFAAATTATATSLYGDDSAEAEAVRDAWQKVEVTSAADSV